MTSFKINLFVLGIYFKIFVLHRIRQLSLDWNMKNGFTSSNTYNVESNKWNAKRILSVKENVSPTYI